MTQMRACFTHSLGFGNIFHSLRYRNFRLFFMGQGASLIGTWVQQVAMSWLVYRLTSSALLLGVVAFSTQFPSFLLSPFAGVLADRHNRHRILLCTQSIALVQAMLLAFLTLAGIITVWQIVLLGALLGCVNSLDIPARHSFIMDMVERKEALGNAIALNSLIFNVARLIGPSIAGILIAVAGEGICFFINALSFCAVIGALLAMDVRPAARKASVAPLLHDIREGFAYAFGFAPIRSILALLAVSSMMGVSYVVLMPVFARDILGGGPKTLGALMASAGAGAIAATLYLASRKNIMGLGRMLPAASFTFGVGLIAFALSRMLWLSMLLLLLTGFGLMVQLALSNTTLQVLVDDDKRGRVMSFYAMSFMGTAPIGSLLAGALASHIGAATTLAAGGVLCALAALLFAARMTALQRILHPIYQKMGIAPAVASGIQTATELTARAEE
jgi:MFS family permease